MKNLIKISILLILGSSFLLSGCISGDCNNGLGIKKYPKGQTYVGEFKNGQKHGYGFLIGNNVLTMGQHHNGRLNGHGLLYYLDTFYMNVGEYYGGVMLEGLLVSEDFIYVGELNSTGLFHGDGILLMGEDYMKGYFKNGDINKKYVHEKKQISKERYFCFEGDCENGLGSYRYKNGEVYIGEWKNRERHGKGILIKENSYYMGEFKYDKITGFGSSCSSNSLLRFIGEHLDGKYVNGLFYSDDPNIGTYVGQWKHPHPHGKGKIIFDISKSNYNKNYIEGYFENGTELSTGRYVIKNPSKPFSD